MDFSTLHKQRKYVLIAAAVGVISCFLPWISAFGFSVNGMHGKGVVVFIAFAAAAAISLFGKTTESLDKAMWMIVLIAGAVALLFTILFLSDLSSVAGFGAGTGFGIWLALLSAVGVLASAWLFKSPADTLQGGFDSLKNKVSSSMNTPTSTTTTSSSKIDELEKLVKMRDEGKITEEEYQQMKSKII